MYEWVRYAAGMQQAEHHVVLLAACSWHWVCAYARISVCSANSMPAVLPTCRCSATSPMHTSMQWASVSVSSRHPSHPPTHGAPASHDVHLQAGPSAPLHSAAWLCFTITCLLLGCSSTSRLVEFVSIYPTSTPVCAYVQVAVHRCSHTVMSLALLSHLAATPAAT